VAIAGTQLMLPANFGTLYANPGTATVTAPIGTGPYVVGNYSSTLVSYKANPSYWVAPGREPDQRSVIRVQHWTPRPRWLRDNWIGLVTTLRTSTRSS